MYIYTQAESRMTMYEYGRQTGERSGLHSFYRKKTFKFDYNEVTRKLLVRLVVTHILIVSEPSQVVFGTALLVCNCLFGKKSELVYSFGV